MDAGTIATLIELAEEPGLWLPPGPSRSILHEEGFSLALAGGRAAVHRVRLAPGEVEAALGRVRALLAERGLAEAVWWVGELSTPPRLAMRLRELGLEPGTPPRMTTLAITAPPDGVPSAEIRRVETLEGFLQALGIEWEAFGVAAEERVQRRADAAEAWPMLLADGSSSLYTAFLDDEPAGFARAVFTPHAALLMGGATLPWARGRGVYSSTVIARWREAVQRGVPRVAVSAGPLSAPVLERLGFIRLGGLELVRDRL